LREGLTSEGKPLKDYVEAKNHAEAIDWLHEVIKENRPLSEGFIKELHALLMRGIEFTYAKGAEGKLIKKPLNVGMYKIRPNHVLTISGKIHKYTDPLHVKDEMEGLLKWLNEVKGTGQLHIVEKVAIFHYRFVAIHPFDDGNGRMARLLMNLILMKAGFPPCIIKNENRRHYLNALELVDTNNDYTPFVNFIRSEILETLRTIAEVISGKSKAMPPEFTGTMNKPQREQMILEVLGKNPMSIGQIQKQIGQIKRPTLKVDLQRLVRAGRLQKAGKGKGVVYKKGKDT